MAEQTPKVDLSGSAWIKLSGAMIVTVASMIGTAVYTYSRIEFRMSAVEIENLRQDQQREKDQAAMLRLTEAINNLAREVSEMKGNTPRPRP